MVTPKEAGEEVDFFESAIQHVFFWYSLRAVGRRGRFRVCQWLAYRCKEKM
jgi:hypothetical protein